MKQACLVFVLAILFLFNGAEAHPSGARAAVKFFANPVIDIYFNGRVSNFDMVIEKYFIQRIL